VTKTLPSRSAAKRPAEHEAAPDIRDIARRAGVSIGTVSNVLNRPAIVRPALRERVREVIQASGYRPNAVAKSLRERRTRTIGLALSDITTPFAGKVARVVEDLAAEADMSVLFADTDERVDREERALRTFFDKGVDGVIVAPAPGDHAFLDAYVARGWPVVAINRQIDNPAVPWVIPDNAGAAAIATQHMIEHGHRRIGVVAPRTRPSSVQERINGYRGSLRRAGIASDRALVVTEDGSVSGGAAAVHRLLRLASAPTAVLSFSSAMTLGIIAALRQSEATVPDDVALIGFDEAMWSVAVAPPLSSIDLRAGEVGERAARLLLDWIETRQRPRNMQHRIATVLLERESCGCTGTPSTRTPQLHAAVAVAD
jgi:LacI family transcriptional regulator